MGFGICARRIKFHVAIGTTVRTVIRVQNLGTGKSLRRHLVGVCWGGVLETRGDACLEMKVVADLSTNVKRRTRKGNIYIYVIQPHSSYIIICSLFI